MQDSNRTIQFAGADTDIIWKFPEENFSNFGSIVVGENQEALFFKSGKILYNFSSGHHSLKSDDFEFLSELAGNTINQSLIAQIYFIQKSIRQKKWGTTAPIAVEDPKYQIMLELRAFGSYRVKVKDSDLLLNTLLNTNQNLSNQQFEAFMRPIIITRLSDFIAEVVAKNQISPVQISQYLDEASETGLKKLCMEFEKYGIELLDFLIESINFDKNDPNFQAIQKILTDKFEIDTLGDKYETKKNLEIGLEAAKNENTAGLGTLLSGVFSGMQQGNQTNNQNQTNQDPNDPMVRLTKLKTLLENGLITQAEFDEKKKEILSSI